MTDYQEIDRLLDRPEDPRVKFGDLPNQDLPLEQASDVLRTWRAKNPAQFGRVLSEVIIKWALRGTEGTDG